jgi:hypothetical protein
MTGGCCWESALQSRKLCQGPQFSPFCGWAGVWEGLCR